ncbi:octopamine receptor [Folsomia candida]|uniref:5-hydroxytryptamine receptor 1A-alpha n=1 Tax=Folsomia candida TaxID=158441 RepID=A0A226EHH6_FOLCA|nr:octopamine receptor [Folsomia candida]OXA57052.1 5-hydroxytryptamine receptor 1A-alpha [Folsomia candida]
MEDLPLLPEETSYLANILTILGGGLLVIVSVVGNGLVIFVFAIDSNFRTLSNFYLASLACTDFLIGLLVIPFGLIYQYNQTWIYGVNYCQVWLTLSYGLSCVSSSHLVFVAIDRYRIMFHGTNYLQQRKLSNMLESVGFVWVIGFWTASPIIADWSHVAVDPEVINHCMPKKTPSWVLLINMMVFVIPAFLMMRLYTVVYLQLRKRLRKKATQSPVTSNPLAPSTSNSNARNEGVETKLILPKLTVGATKNTSRNIRNIGEEVRKRKMQICLQKEKKAALTLGLLIGLFLICWSPYLILTTIQAFSPDTKIPKIFNTTSALFGWINSCGNCFVYVYVNKDFRKSLSKMFKCLWK